MLNIINVDFTSDVQGGASPLLVNFTQQITLLSADGNATNIGYNWNFDYNNPDSPWVYTTSNTIANTFVGTYLDKFTIALSANVSGTYSFSNSQLVYKTDYIGTAGIEPIRYTPNRDLNLVNFLPSMYDGTETYQFTQFIGDFLNNLFEGNSEIDSTLSDISVSGNYSLNGDGSLNPYEYYATVSAISATSATTQNTEQQSLSIPTDQSMQISLIEKIYRLTELKDPDLIDINNIQYFAQNMGYNLNVYRDEVGNIGSDFGNRAPANIYTSATDSNRYLRFMVSNLPNWYKVKTTESAIKVMLYSFGWTGDILYYFTDTYLPTGNWLGVTSDNINNVPENYFLTPHFSIRVDLDVKNLSTNLNSSLSIIRAVQDIQPINTVFRSLIGSTTRYFTKTISMMSRTTRYIRVTA